MPAIGVKRSLIMQLPLGIMCVGGAQQECPTGCNLIRSLPCIFRGYADFSVFRETAQMKPDKLNLVPWAFRYIGPETKRPVRLRSNMTKGRGDEVENVINSPRLEGSTSSSQNPSPQPFTSSLPRLCLAHCLYT